MSDTFRVRYNDKVTFLDLFLIFSSFRHRIFLLEACPGVSGCGLNQPQRHFLTDGVYSCSFPFFDRCLYPYHTAFLDSGQRGVT